MRAVPVGDVTRAGSLIEDWFLRKTHLLCGLFPSPGYLQQLPVTSPGLGCLRKTSGTDDVICFRNSVGDWFLRKRGCCLVYFVLLAIYKPPAGQMLSSVRAIR